MKPEAVLFDMDGVIFDSERAIYHLALELAEEEGVPDLPRVYPQLIGVTRARSVSILRDWYGPDFPYDRYRQIVTVRYHEKYDHGRLPLKTGVRETLSGLAGRGLRLAVASSTPGEVVRAQITDAGLAPFFEQIIGGDQVRNSKPDPEIFLLAASSLGVPPRACYVIEDSFNGIRAAAAGGMIPVMVPDMLEPDAEIRSLAAGIFADLPAANAWIAHDCAVRDVTP